MSSPFVAEIRIFGFNFPPTGWALCDGQLLPISQNTALFSLIGTFYGGDGKSTFGLPNLQDSVPLHVGGNQPGPGLSTYFLGQQSGESSVTLIQTEMPAHSHTVMGIGSLGNRTTPVGNSISRVSGSTPFVPGSPAPPLVSMAATTIAPTGGSFPHNNMMPYLTLNFCIALQGVFPPRSAPTQGAPTRTRKPMSGTSTPIGVLRDE
jgi:microcystin-dependent protein